MVMRKMLNPWPGATPEDRVIYREEARDYLAMCLWFSGGDLIATNHKETADFSYWRIWGIDPNRSTAIPKIVDLTADIVRAAFDVTGISVDVMDSPETGWLLRTPHTNTRLLDRWVRDGMQHHGPALVKIALH